MRRLNASWSRLALSGGPCARSSHGLSAVNGLAYLFGGEGIARHAIDSTIHALDANGGTWTACGTASGAVPSPRVGHAQCALDNKLMVFGGRTDVDMGEGNLNDLWAFEPASNAWQKLDAAGGEAPSPRSFHAAAGMGDTMYVFGGCGAEGRLADLHAFDRTSRRWSKLPEAPLAGRGGATLEASSDGRSLWLCAGFAGHETNDLLRYDVATSTWHTLSAGWLRPRSVVASMSLAHPSGPALLLFGGEVAPSDRGHEGAGGFASDLIAIDGLTGDPIQLEVDGSGQGGEAPRARGWAAATPISPSEAVLFGGLSGSDETPERLDDAWLLRVGEPMAYSRDDLKRVGVAGTARW